MAIKVRGRWQKKKTGATHVCPVCEFLLIFMAYFTQPVNTHDMCVCVCVDGSVGCRVYVGVRGWG